MKNHKETAMPKDLVSDLKALVGDAQTMIGDSVSEHSSEALAQLRARFEGAQERLSELYDGAKTKVVAGARYTDSTIRENPYESLAIAAGVGLLIGVLVGRRSK
ncbi:MAG: hypothetical protein ABIV50_00295 [Opitutus sp.]